VTNDRLSAIEAPALHLERGEQVRLWRTGFEAGLREHRRLVFVGIVVALLVLFRRHLHPVVALIWVLAVVLALAPFLILALALEAIRREHRRRHLWHRTLAMAATWLAGLGLVTAVLWLAWTPLVLMILPVATGAWIVDGHRQSRRKSTSHPPPT
jgi:hypothetical protein